MGRNFVRASTHYLEYAAPVVTAAPFAVSLWFRTTDLTVRQTLFGIGDVAGTGNYWTLQARCDVALDPLNWAVNAAGAGEQICGNNGVTANVWIHAAAIEAAADNRSVFRNGVVGTNATSRAPAGLDNTTIGRIHLSSFFDAMSGDIAEVAVWDLTNWGADAAARTANFTKAVTALAAGVSVMNFPLGLVAYWPLYGLHSPEIDVHPRSNLSTDFPMTVNSAAAAIHPQVEPRSRRLWGQLDQNVVVASTGNPWYYYAQQGAA